MTVYDVHDSALATTTEYAITATGIRKSYGSTSVLDGVELSVTTGSVFALLGPNGAGKSTMIRILSTLVRPDAGTATVAGHDVVRAAPAVRRAISLTGQHAAVDELLTGRENLLLMARLRHLSRRDARRRTTELLDDFDLVEAADRAVGTYSGGMRRRLDLAASLVTRPAVIFLDEPTTGLDPRSRQTMWDVVRGLAADGVTIFLTTQYLEEADQLADRIALLDRGRVVAEGTADELKRRLAVEQVELTFAPEDFSRAVPLLGVASTGADPQRHTVTVPTDGTAAAVRDVLVQLEQHGVPVATISLRRPSLDDVFLTLTAR